MISPEGCASILWRSGERAADAAEAMKVTAEDLKRLGVVDVIVPEPVGGAQRDPTGAAKNLATAIASALDDLSPMDGATLRTQRRDKFLAMGGL